MMVVGVLVLLFVGSCAYDDEQSALLQASIKSRHGDAEIVGVNTSATYTKYRIYTTRMSSPSAYGFWCLGGVYFYGATGAAISGMTVTASAGTHAGHAPSNTINGVCKPHFCSLEAPSPSKPAWLAFTFPTATTVARIRLVADPNAVDQVDPYDIEIQGNDGNTWDTLATIAGINHGLCATTDITLAAQGGGGGGGPRRRREPRRRSNPRRRSDPRRRSNPRRRSDPRRRSNPRRRSDPRRRSNPECTVHMQCANGWCNRNGVCKDTKCKSKKDCWKGKCGKKKFCEPDWEACPKGQRDCPSKTMCDEGRCKEVDCGSCTACLKNGKCKPWSKSKCRATEGGGVAWCKD